MTRSALPGFAIALIVLLAGLALAFTLGRYPIGLGDVLDVLAAKLTGRVPSVPGAVENVILQVRGPRVIAALLVGGALAVAGTAFQGLFRNPLVSPDILGASSGAALGAVLGIYFSLGVFGIESLAFLGGLAAVAAVYLIGTLVPARDPILLLVLAGVVIGALLGAGVGLVVPHLARALVGPDFPRLLPTAALLGGGYLLFIDTLARVAAPVEIPLGILTAAIGTPFFIWLLTRMQRTWS